MFDSATKSCSQVFAIAILALLFMMTGCRRQTAPEQTYEKFISALEERNQSETWRLLTKRSQQRWDKAAQAYGLVSGKVLFAKGSLWRNRELRPNPDKPPVIRNNMATLTFFDELNQRVSVTLRKENGQWRIQLPISNGESGNSRPSLTRPRGLPSKKPALGKRPVSPTAPRAKREASAARQPALAPATSRAAERKTPAQKPVPLRR